MRSAAGGSVSADSIVHGALRLVLRALWFALIPALLSALCLRYLVPHSTWAPGVEGPIAEWAREHALWLALSLFLGFVGVLRYWRNWLPGGRYLSLLPAQLVARVPRRRIAGCEAAWALLSAIDGRVVSTRLATASAELRATMQAARAELLALLGTGKWSKVSAAEHELRSLVLPFLVESERKSGLVFVALLVASGLLALQLRARFAQAYEVSGTSMLPSLTPGEMLAGSVAAYSNGQPPRRGDVIVLQVLVGGKPAELIKRVIGLPGDHIDLAGVHPVINGWPVPLCDVGAYYSPDDETSSSGDPGARVVMEFLEGQAYLTLQATVPAPFSDYVVKPGEVFVMGDNRSNSRDSRGFDEGRPRGFALQAVKAKITRVLFERTRAGAIDLSSPFRSLSPRVAQQGVDTRALQATLNACLAQRPKSASPPSSPSTALASHD